MGELGSDIVCSERELSTGSAHMSVCEVLRGDGKWAAGSCVGKQAGAVSKDEDYAGPGTISSGLSTSRHPKAL